MTDYIGSGPYCYANSLAMMLGAGAPSPSVIEVLTGSPFGFEILGGRLPLFDPYGWDPDRGLDDAIRLLGWTCHRTGAEDDDQALDMLRDALEKGPVLAGPVEFGLLRHLPGMTGPINSDHFVVVLEIDGDLVRFHDPHGCPYATLPVPDFLAAWRADTIGYRTTAYTMRGSFQRVRPVSADDALRAALPGAAAWLRGREDLPVPAGTVGGEPGVHLLADQITEDLDPGVREHLAHFAIRVGARRLADAATVLTRLGHDRAAAVATRQARLVGALQRDIVAGDLEPAVETLRQLAPTYPELAGALG
ncbi:hypothetical protein FHR83_003821 [Actinoplanes campanulatus]|uniref:Butirosin biosynthesis protein H, N-terminal n=1 Tax=Actinoplanes campanulatus TaxID=113559 RepID=A0A7W5AH08_9ACTN|nr:hypothetical protein [Actinoplanes campanulatus]MBB3096151.1 hypothetical protein [Actinoplanes campanulatus]GGN14144.1 hypothetical protein GCM10010109_25350 [Actinoplanes campanulatus]GID36755.1 hypothetical protein Aca09nite_32610 [Actinoplanes campanulatus]